MEYKEKLEIRGISRDELFKYVQELGGERLSSNSDMILFQSDKWSCTLSSEETFYFMHSDIPIVHVSFHSSNEDALRDILRKFRLKTFRAGG
ncbi:hypothetical protein CR194_02435 [Salipaludibacillus keqinensis]|uniref:Molybdopterin cofactor biosynthesis MoaD-related C-terminal domain-containing protein n=1 Tax=Salipaludibacillus keqinensis TaxID=2045207 RepID=A0A323TIN9_9BACI|nr:hypothetical protein [Salipaludibacillus keqinensis]PYZ94410.1 hypothetical protein CR194_02435 [Salipaludibacillus keqinensis]